MVSKIAQNGFNRHPDAWNVGILSKKAKKHWIKLNTIDSMFNGDLKDYNFNKRFYYGQ